jgi:protein SCO1/2
MRTLLITLLLLIDAASGQTLAPGQLHAVDFEQKLGATIPLDVVLHDETGAPVRLGSYFGERPVVLALADYQCVHLCNVVLNSLLESARDLRLDAGRDFDIVIVNLRPNSAPSLAAAKKQTFVSRYGRAGANRGWHFLSGDADAVRRLADAVGFRYAFEPASGQFAHPSGIVVLTPAGRVSHYLLGIEFPPKDLRAALLDASQQRIGSLASRLLLLCFHYDPRTGRYGLLITRVMQVAGIGTALGLAAMIVHLRRREQRATS